jgi:2-haloacid dehalogenase
VLFDAYGTLFDVYSVALTAEQLFPGAGNALAQLWRDKQIDYTRLVSMSGPRLESTQGRSQVDSTPTGGLARSGRSGGSIYQPFWAITRNALKFSAEKLGLALTAEGEERLMNQYRHLSAFPENREVLQALKARGVRTGILSNGDPDMLAVAVKSAGLTELLDDVLSVHATQTFKTDPAAYQVGVDALRLPPKEILFVSSNGWDAIGATWFGYTTLWVNRAGLPLEQLDTSPTRTGASLRDVLGFFTTAAA